MKLVVPSSGIDDPRVFGLAPRTGLFGEDRVVRIGLQQRVDDRLLGRVVDFGDEVAAPLGADAHDIEVDAGAIDDGTGLARGLDGRVEHRMHGGRMRQKGRGDWIRF